MAKYRERRDENGIVDAYIRTSDNGVIPANAIGNKDYDDVQTWLADGNVPDSDPNILTLADFKSKGLTRIRESANNKIKITGEWAKWRQGNAQLGIYGTVLGGSKPVLQHCTDYITSIIIQSNVYEDQIKVALDKTEIDAVIPVWDTTGIFSYTEVKNGA